MTTPTTPTLALTRDESLIIKGVGILMMIYHHIFAFPERLPFENINTYQIKGYDLLLTTGSAGKLCVSLFFFISGYALSITAENHPGILSGIQLRLRAFYTVFWVNFLFWVPLLLCVHNPEALSRIEETNCPALIKNFLLLSASICPEWWFGIVYVQAVLLVWPALVGIRKIAPLFIPLSGLLLMGLAQTGKFTGLFESLMTWITPFCIGYFLADSASYTKYLRETVSGSRLRRLGMAITIGISLLIAKLNIRAEMDWTLIPFLIPALLCLTSSMSISAPIYFIGRYSAAMWLNHGFFIYYIFPKYIFFFENRALGFILSVACSLACAMPTHWLAELITSRWNHPVRFAPRTRLGIN